MKRIIPLFAILMMFSGITLVAQNPVQSVGSGEELINIPPLNMLIDSALAYSPLLHTKDLEITIKEMEWRAQRWEWTDFIQPFTEYRFGTVDNYVLGQQAGTVLEFQQTAAHRFNVGARINLTIFKAINYRSKLKLADKGIELDQARRKEIELLVKQEVVRLWNMLVTYRSLLVIKSELVIAQAANLAEAELLYKSGEVPIMELARIKEISSKAEEGLVLSKKEFREAYYLLYELVGKTDITIWAVN